MYFLKTIIPFYYRVLKILGLISSPRFEGNTAKLVREVLKSAQEYGAETEEVFLYDKKIEFCRGCSNCLKTGKCAINDDFESVKETIRSADGLVIGSPVLHMPGFLKED